MQYYLGQYVWIESQPYGYWEAPNISEVNGCIDLRSINSQGKSGGVPEGYCFLESDNLINNPNLIYLGDDKTVLTTKQKSNLSSLLGIVVDQDTPIEILYEILTVKNDKTKICPPLMPDIKLNMDLKIGGISRKSVKLIPEVSPEWPVVLKQLQDDYVDIKNADSGDQLYRKLLTVYSEKFNIQDTSKFIPVGQPIESPLPHNTTYTESFTAADGDTLAGDLTWTEVSGDIDISSNLATHTAANSEAHARAEHDVSSTDHYAQINSVFMRSSSNTYVTGVLARYSSSASTKYGFRALRSSTVYKYELFKFVSGTFTSFGSTNYSWVANDVLKVHCNGSTISGYLNGTSVQSTTDTAITTNTRGGIIMYSNDGFHVDIDNFEIGDLSSGSNTTATPSLASLTVLVNQPTTNVSNSAIATPSLASITVQLNSPTTSSNVSATATPSLASVTVLVNQPTTNGSQSSTATPTVTSVTVLVQQATASTGSSTSSTATPSLASATITVNTPTVTITNNVNVFPGINIVNITVPQPTTTTGSGTNVSPSLASVTILVNTPTVSIKENRIATPSLASASFVIYSPTITTGVFGGISIKIVLKSEIEKRLNKPSRVEKYLNLKSTLVNQ